MIDHRTATARALATQISRPVNTVESPRRPIHGHAPFAERLAERRLTAEKNKGRPVLLSAIKN